MMNITGSLLSSWWHNRVPKDEIPDQEKIVNNEVVEAPLT
jgi:hypothetical protein